MSIPATMALQRSPMLPKKLPIAIYSYNQWYTGRVKKCCGSKVQVSFDKLDDSMKCVPTLDTTVDLGSICRTSALTFPCPYIDCDKHQPGNHFQDKSRWQQHIRMHNGTAPRCPFCHAMDANLRRHIRRHGREGPVRPLIISSADEIDKMKVGVLRACLEAAGVPFKHFRGEEQLRERLRRHKGEYKQMITKGILAVMGDIAPKYAGEQQAIAQYIEKRLEDGRVTIGNLMVQLLQPHRLQMHHPHQLNEKNMLKKLEKKMVEMQQSAAPGSPQYLKAFRCDTNGDGVRDGFKIDTNNDGLPDTYVRVVSPPGDGSGRWSRTVKKRRLGDMKEDQLNVSAVMNEKDAELRKAHRESKMKDAHIQQLMQQLEVLQMGGPRPAPIDVSASMLTRWGSIPPPVNGDTLRNVSSAPARLHMSLLPPELEPSTPILSAGHPPLQRPHSPRWNVLEQSGLYDTQLIGMLKEKGFTDSNYWGGVTRSIIEQWEDESGMTIKPGVKLKFLDVYGTCWSEGDKVEVLNGGVWTTGEVMMSEVNKVTILSRNSLRNQQDLITISRDEACQKIRTPTEVTQMKKEYEMEILRLRRQVSSGSQADSSGTESDLARTPSPDGSSSSDGLDNTLMVKEEPKEESIPPGFGVDFNWATLAKDTLPVPSLVGYDRTSPDFLAFTSPGMASINTESPWDNDGVLGATSTTSSYRPSTLHIPATRYQISSMPVAIQDGAAAAMGVLPPIRLSARKFMVPEPMETPEPPNLFG